MRKRISLILATAFLCVGNLVAQGLSHNLTIGESKYASLMLGFNAEIPEGVKAYVAASVSDGYVHFSEVEGNVIAASTPVLLKAEVAGDYAFAHTEESAAEVGDNLLEGVLYSKSVSMSSDYNYYVFDEGECVWLPAVAIEGMEDCFSATANTAYLQVPTTMAESYSNLLISSVTASGTCGDNLTWVLTEEGELIVEGTGAMTDYEPHSAPWFAYKDEIKTVTIKPGVTTIGKYAIGDCSNLTTVTIPEGVTSIGLQAFQYCYKLASVTLSDGLKTIDWGAFAECHELPSIDIPEGVTTIGNYAFTHCYKLSSVTIPESVTSIGIYAFRNTAITSVVIPANISSLSQGTFENCPNLASITCKAETPPSVGHSETFYNVNRSIPVYVPVSAVAAYKEADYWKEFTNFLPMGTCGDDLTWKLTDEGELTIEGTGAMTDYSYGNWAPWYDYKESIVSINIGEGVSSIANQTFRDCTNLIAVTIPASVATIGELAFYNCPSLATANMAEDSQLESIGYNAFRGCKSLTDFAIPATVTNIGEHAFHGCEELASITIPVGMTTIETRAFQDCRKFNTITIPAGVTTIKDCAFYGCENLETINFPENSQLIAIGTEAFYNCQKLGSVIIPASVTTMGEGVFKSCIGLISATIPAGVTTIEYETFESCSSLTNVVFPENSQLTTIGTEAFWSSGLTSIAIPANVTTIGSDAFRYCDNLTSVIIPDNSQLTTIGFASFLGCSALTSITLPAGLTSLDMAAFKGCTGLTTMTCNATTPPAVNSSETFYDINRSIPVYVPVSAIDAYKEADYWKEFTNFLPMGACGDNLTWKLTEEGELIIEGTGDMYNYHEEASGINHPWLKCRSQIKTITIGEGVTSIGNTAFRDCTELTSISLNNDLKHIGVEAFRYCGKLTAIDFPESLTSIANSSFFECRGLLSVTIPEGVTSIDFSTFYDCSSLKSLILPSGITSIGGNAFKACHNLTEIVCRATTPPSISSNTFNSVSREAFVYVPHASIGAYESAEHWSEFTNIQPMIIASGFCGDDLTWHLNDAYELTIEGTGAMYDYSNSTAAPWQSYAGSIKSVVIKTGVTGIGSWAFSQCSALTDVSIAESVIRIGGDAFRECSTLEEITLPKGLTELGTGVFLYCSALKSITVPEGVTKIGSDTFEFCPQLSSITFPSSLTEIGPWALKGAYNLASITCKAATPPSLGNEAFSGVSNAITVYVPASSVEAYKTANGWSQFANIQPMIIASGAYNENITWKYIDGGALVIEGTGVIPDYTQPWSDYKQSIKSITVGEGITVLGSAAFSGCGKCTEVNLPNSLTDIRYEAFFVCSSLPSITLPKNVRNVGGRVFCDCGSLASVTLNEGLESLGGETFRACGALKSIEIPSSMKEIAGAFYECKHLASVTIPEGVQKIASGAFCYCNDMASLTLPASLTSIGGNAFKQCVKLAYIEARATTPPTIEGSDAFTEVDKNVPVYVPASSVEAYKAADYWSLFANILPMGICGDELAWKLTAEGELIIEGTGAMTSAPWSTYAESIKKVTIKEGVTSIYDRAFEGCNQVETMTIPNSVVEVGTSAFNDCTGELFLNSMPVPAEGSMMMGGAFESCGFTKVIVGEGVTEIKDMAFFYSQNLAEVELPETIERIGDMAFAYCHSLTSITIPASVTTIDSYAFDNCVNFTTFVCKGMTPPTCIGELFYNVNKELTLFVPITAIANYQVAAQWKDFDYIVGTAMCGETLTGELWPDGKLIVKGEGAITTAPWEAYGEQVKELVLEEGVTGIADKSFVGFDNLLSITSYAENPPVCSAEAFNGVEKTTPVYVVPSKLEDYSVSEGWCEFIYLTSNDSRILLDSYVDYSHEEDESFEEIAYVRTFNNTNWQALYVPFEIPVTEEFLSDFEVADLNDIRQYDRDDDGVKDETAVEAFKVTSGTLKANYPYLIRAKEAGEKTIIVADATLYATKENSYDCSSLHEKYTFTPTYSRIEGFALAGCYALSGGVWQPIDEEEALGAFRFYLMIESRDGNLQVARTIRLRIIGGANDDDTTRIDTAESTVNGRQSAVVYDLQGRRVVNPTKGIYIVNGKKLMY